MIEIKCKAENFKLIPIEQIVPNPKNNNRHSIEQINAIAKLIKAHGFREPLTISNRSGFLNCGHARLEAAKTLGMTELPVIYQDFTSEAEEYQHMTADNEIARWAELDFQGVYDALKEIPDIDTSLLGIEDFKLPEVVEPQCDEDEVPEAPVEPITKLGDIYKLGNHRLMCGDATVLTDVEKLLGEDKPNLMVTDPPYGVKLDQSWRDKAMGEKSMGAGNKNIVENDERADWYDAWVLFPGNIAYIWHASSFTDVVMDSLRRANFEIKQQIIWNKNILVMGRSYYHWKHEPCWYAVKKGADHNWVGDRKQVTVWDGAIPNHIMSGSKEDKTEHPTQKPLMVYEIPINNQTRTGDYLYEPFGGSGSCIIACEKTGRRSLTMELSPKYCDIIVARWEKFTGKKAELINGC
jgi:DNA modification methylase